MQLMQTTSNSRLHSLDLSFGRLRRLWESPILRARFSERMGQAIDPGLIRTLRAVAELGDECGVREAAAFLGIDASTASRTVEQAVTAGYLDRATSSSDRRRSALSVTAEGREVLDRALRIRQDLLSELTEDWSDNDVEQLAVLLERLAASVADLENRT